MSQVHLILNWIWMVILFVFEYKWTVISVALSLFVIWNYIAEDGYLGWVKVYLWRLVSPARVMYGYDNVGYRMEIGEERGVDLSGTFAFLIHWWAISCLLYLIWGHWKSLMSVIREITFWLN